MFRKAFGSAFVYSIFAQAANSGASFLYTIFLARVLSKSDFGVYGVGFSIGFLLAGIANSIVHTQIAVNFFSKPLSDRCAYIWKMQFGLIFLLAAVWLVYELGVLAISTLGLVNSSWGGGAIGFSMVAFSLKDYLVRVAYTRQSPHHVFSINMVFCAFLLLGALFLFLFSEYRSANLALVFLGGANLFAFLFGLYIFNYWRECQLSIKDAFNNIIDAFLNGGAWYLCVTFATALQSQFYTFFVAAKLGLDEVAVMNAARIFMMPPIVLIPVFNQFYLPRFMQAGGGDRERDLNRVVGLLVGLVILYSILVVLFHDFLFSKMIPWKADNSIEYLLAWSLSVLAMVVKSGILIKNHAEKKFRRLFFINLLGGGVCIVFSVVFTAVLGGPGVIVALAVSDLVIWYAFRYVNSSLG